MLYVLYNVQDTWYDLHTLLSEVNQMATTLFADEVVLVTDLRKNLSAYLDKVRLGQPITIVQGNRADVALVSRADLAAVLREADRARRLAEQLESIIETAEIIADEETMDKIRQSEEDITAGRYVTLNELKAELGYNNG
jgi:prevent-host-death family protein